MSKISSVEDRLARLLDTPWLARVVPHLPPEALHRLIRDRGLDACGEIVTSATPAQLTTLIDLDLWRHARPGRDAQFDVDRFGEWLEVLADTGDAVAARTVAALDKEVVVAGLSRYVRVLDPGIFEPTAQSDDEPPDRDEAMREGDAIHAGDVSLGNCPECEVGGYVVRARRADAWDAIVALLLALEAGHGEYFHAVMHGCRRLSNSPSEIDGLDDLLLAPEQHFHDVTLERERRRSRQGYATAADARAFLQMARQPADTRSGAPMPGTIAANPIVAAYFRAADEALESSSETVRSPERTPESSALPCAASGSSHGHSHAADVPESLEAVLELLSEAGVMPARPRALLDAAAADGRTATLPHLRRLMAYVRETDEGAYVARSRELAFLANTLLAGCSVQSRPFTPQEASDAAAAICNLGLEYGTAGFPPDSWVVDQDLVTAFEAGWSILHREVSMFAAEQLISILSSLPDVDRIDRDIRLGLVALRRTLMEQRDGGTPWQARAAAEILATIDMTVWVGVLGILDECPVLPAALTAVLDRRTTAVSPTEFDFISTAAQIADVRIFMQKLPDLLLR